MRSKLLAFLREQAMVQPGDKVVCAVSGGADSMAMLWAMWLMKDQLKITVEAAHFNHNLRGEESNRDEAFVVAFCKNHNIPCHVGAGKVEPGEKGLEAAARNARYAYLQSLPGKIATAHTADDNAETLLLHLVRGTGLKGLGGIAPIRGNLIRPMLTVTRREVLDFLDRHKIPYVTDSSNETDAFLRNRIRHHVMPLLRQENPSLAENLSAAALRLRQDEAALDQMAEPTTDVAALRQMPPAVQTRALAKLLVHFGVKEPEAEHIAFLRRIVCSDNPSACGEFPGNVILGRQYHRLVKLEVLPELGTYVLNCPGETYIPELGVKVICRQPDGRAEGLALYSGGGLTLRSRRPGDTITLSGGTKSLKKLFIDRKIPASQRGRVPVLADDAGVAAVVGIGPNRNRTELPNWEIILEPVLCQPALRNKESGRINKNEK